MQCYSIAKIHFSSSHKKNVEYNEISENELISIIEKYKNEYKTADNGLGEGAARIHRRNDICSRENTLKITNWTGKISYLSSTENSKGILTVNISPEISLQTASSKFSDSEENPTLISEDSPFYENLSKMKEGDNVIFSGNFLSDRDDCFKENSITMTGGMFKPDFMFHFSSVSLSNDNIININSEILSDKDIKYVHRIVWEKIKNEGIYGLSKYINKCYISSKSEKTKNICILEDLSSQLIDKDIRNEISSLSKKNLPPIEFFSEKEISKRFDKYILPEFHSYEKINEVYSKPVSCVISKECKN